MNHAGIALVETDPHFNTTIIQLPVDVLHPLAVAQDGLLQAVYYPYPYPTDCSDTSGWPPSLRHDLVVSPIPFRLWPKVLIVRVRLTHDPDAILKLADFLKSTNCSILHSEFLRSGHRHATWNLVAGIDDIPDEVLSFNVKTSLYRETLSKQKSVEKQLLSDCADILFKDENDCRLKTAFHVWTLPGLSYFHHFSRTRVESTLGGKPALSLPKHLQNIPGWLHEPFNLTCRQNNLISDSDEHSIAVLKKIFPDFKQPFSTPAFAHLDTREYLIRLTLLPPDAAQTFFAVGVEFTRNGEPDTSRGWMLHVVKHLPRDLKVWQICNHTRHYRRGSERGATWLLVEDTSLVDMNAHQSYDVVVRAFHELRRSDFRVGQGSRFDILFRVERLTRENVMTALHRKMKEDQEIRLTRDVFLSYSSINQSDAKTLHDTFESRGLRCYMAPLYLESGAEVEMEIRKALLASREVCILCSREMLKSQWALTEWGAAWALQKRITPVLLRMNIDELPIRLQAKEVRYFDDREKLAEEVWQRKRTHIENCVSSF